MCWLLARTASASMTPVSTVSATARHPQPGLCCNTIGLHVAAGDDAANCIGNLVGMIAVGSLQHPGEFAQNDRGYRHGLAALDNSRSGDSLLRIVQGQEAHQNVGIERAAQRPRPTSMASCISASEIRRCLRRQSIPRRLRRSWPEAAGASSTRPSGSNDTPTLSPGLTPRWSNTALRNVTWPLAVTVRCNVIFCKALCLTDDHPTSLRQASGRLGLSLLLWFTRSPSVRPTAPCPLPPKA